MIPSIDSANRSLSDPVELAASRFLQQYIASESRILVGFSGGLDSVVLLNIARQYPVEIVAVHVHHGLSPNADQWAAFCQSTCESWNIPIQLFHVAVPQATGEGLEAAARRLRHAAFQQVTADWILLAHHQGDRAETVLFNLLRGAGVRGAGTMRARQGRILRPLLSVSREDIHRYALAKGLRWIEDESNADIRHSRNFLRHVALPEIESRFPAAVARLASAGRRFEEASNLLDELARLDLAPDGMDFPVAVKKLAGLPEPRARNVLRYLLSHHGVGIPSEERLSEALRQCLEARPDRHPSIAFGKFRICRRGKWITLED